MVKEVAYLEQQLNLFTDYGNAQESQDSSYGKTYPAHLVVIREMILEPCSKKSQRPKFQCLKMDDGQSQVVWNGGGYKFTCVEDT